ALITRMATIAYSPCAGPALDLAPISAFTGTGRAHRGACSQLFEAVFLGRTRQRQSLHEGLRRSDRQATQTLHYELPRFAIAQVSPIRGWTHLPRSFCFL